MGSVDQSLQTLTQKLRLVSRHYVLRSTREQEQMEKKSRDFLCQKYQSESSLGCPREPTPFSPVALLGIWA